MSRVPGGSPGPRPAPRPAFRVVKLPRIFVRRFGELALACLRELADENAYRRYLERHGREHSGEEWRRFSEERLRAKYVRAKCC